MPTFAATLLPGAFRTFKDLYPDIAISLNDVITEEVVELVRNGKVEIGISFHPKITDDLQFQSLFRDHFVAVLPAHHVLASAKTLSFEEILNEPFLSLKAPSLVTELIEEAARAHSLQFKSIMQAHQLATIGRMVSEGIGVSIVPEVCTQQMTEMGAVCRPLNDVDISSDIGLLTLKRKALSAAAESFLSVIDKAFVKAPS
jgi:LysR family carnitine catabolism transcriptional activator